MKRILSLFLALVMALGFAALVPPGAQAEEVTEIDLATVSIGVAYINANGKYRITGTAPKNGGIMVSPGVVAQITLEDVTIEEAAPDFAAFELEVKAGTGTPHTGVQVFLTLIGTNKLKGSSGRAGLAVPAGANLTITADSTGSLEAIGVDNGAGIGGGGSDRPDFSKSIVDAGTITINGGTVTATAIGGASAAAGIGGGSDGAGGTVIITGGTVTATGGTAGGGRGGAGIGGGGGNLASASGTISISGGEVTAIAGGSAMAIGAGYGGTPPSGALGLGTVGSITFGGLYHYWTNTWTEAPGEKTGGGAFTTALNASNLRYVRLQADNEPPVIDLEAEDLKPGPNGKLDFTGTIHNMNITFNEQMKAEVGTVTLNGVAQQILDWGTESNTRCEVKLENLANGTPYELVISGFQDFVGNTMEPVSYKFTTAIKDVPVLIPTPMTGEAPEKATATADTFVCGEVTWDPAVTGNAFASGVEYTATVVVTPIDGYEFTTLGVNATINGHSAVKENAKTEITLSYKFPATKLPIRGTAALAIATPVTNGEALNDVTVSGTKDNFTVSEDDGVKVKWTPAHALFEVNTVYTAEITLTPDGTHAFTDDFTVTINGRTPTTFVRSEDGAITVAYAFRKTVPPGTGTIGLEDEDGPHINLALETISLPAGFTVAAYSVNGGEKWTKGALPTDAAKLSKLFDKDLTLWLIDDADSKGKPTDAASYIKFPAISKRPKANEDKLKPFYLTDTWVLAKADGIPVFAGYEQAPSTDKKNPSGPWAPASPTSVIAGKDKLTYLVRTAAVAETESDTYAPASKIFKVSPANLGKEPKYKADYKKEIIKLKKGDEYAVGTGAFTLVEEAKGIELDISAHITAGTAITVRKAASGKKPRTEEQTITLLTRLTLVPEVLTVTNGKMTFDKKYEVWDTAKSKWGGAPKVTTAGNHVFDIRLKTTVKGTTGNAASATGKLDIAYGPYKDSKDKDKNGILSALISSSE
ncbi:MAG: hypothetical protein FWH16_05315 [Oscillospiraceae bacterium]|nr:hypothetical protein [Oscillospiraceae bacterium]